MIKTHKHSFSWSFSSQLLSNIEHGWKRNRWCAEPTVHFYFGLGGYSAPENIKKNEKEGEDYYIVDIGYIGAQINRWPKPVQADFTTTYFRFCKNSMHNDLTNVSDDPTRFNELVKKDIWYAKAILEYEEKELNYDGKLLVTPSSDTVCKYIHGQTQKQWLSSLAPKIKKHSNREIELRLKPNPRVWANLKYKNVQDHFPHTYALVTNMSLCAIDAVVHGIPVICDKENICSSIGETNYSKIENLKSINKDDLYKWACKVANQQFTLEEIYKGVPNDYL